MIAPADTYVEPADYERNLVLAALRHHPEGVAIAKIASLLALPRECIRAEIRNLRAAGHHVVNIVHRAGHPGLYVLDKEKRS